MDIDKESKFGFNGSVASNTFSPMDLIVTADGMYGGVTHSYE
jgi:hypothetical protein